MSSTLLHGSVGTNAQRQARGPFHPVLSETDRTSLYWASMVIVAMVSRNLGVLADAWPWALLATPLASALALTRVQRRADEGIIGSRAILPSPNPVCKCLII